MKLREIVIESAPDAIKERWFEKFYDMMANQRDKELINFLDTQISNPSNPKYYLVIAYMDDKQLTKQIISRPMILFSEFVWNDNTVPHTEWWLFLDRIGRNMSGQAHNEPMRARYMSNASLVKTMLEEKKTRGYNIGEGWRDCNAFGISLTSFEEAEDNYNEAVEELKAEFEHYQSEWYD